MKLYRIFLGAHTLTWNKDANEALKVLAFAKHLNPDYEINVAEFDEDTLMRNKARFYGTISTSNAEIEIHSLTMEPVAESLHAICEIKDDFFVNFESDSSSGHIFSGVFDVELQLDFKSEQEKLKRRIIRAYGNLMISKMRENMK